MVLLAVLILVSTVQAVQLNGLKSTISEGKLTINSANSGASTTSASNSAQKNEAVPKSIQNLPQMVGGC